MTTPSVKSVLSASKMTADTSRRRMLKDNSWIRRDAEEDEPVDYDPNFGRAVLGRLKSTDDVDNTAVNSGTSVSSFTKNITTTNTKSSVTMPSSPTKPPVPAKNTMPKTSPNTSGFTARVFSANTNNKTTSPVTKSFGEKLPEVTVSQTTNRQDKTYSTGPSSPAPLPTTVKSSSVVTPMSPTPVKSPSSVKSSSVMTPMSPPPVKSPSSVKSSSVMTPMSPPPVKSPSRNENISFAFESPTSSITTTKRTITTSSSGSMILDETQTTKPSERNNKLSDASYSSSYTSPSSDTLSTRYYTSQSSSAPLEDLADTLIPTRSGSLHSQSVQSRRTITTSSSGSMILDETQTTKPSERNFDNYKLSDVSYSSSYTSPSSDTLSTRYYTSQSSSAPLEDLADTSITTRSGSLHSQSVQSRTQVMSYDQPFSSVSQTLYSPTKTTFSETTSTRAVSSRDCCSVCGKPIAGAPRMILEDLKIISHTSCFKCSMCHTDLGNLEAGRTIWVYRDRVNCSNCYSKVKSQWYM